MFKSLFSKYVSAFMLIIVLSFVVIITITSSVIGRHSERTKRELMQNSAETVELYLEDMLETGGDSLSTLVNNDKGVMKKTLDLLVSSAGDASVLLTDINGKTLLLSGYEDNRLANSEPIPPEIFSSLGGDGIYTDFTGSEGRFEYANMLCAGAIEDSDGKICGYVFVFSESIMMEEIVEIVGKIVISSIVWVLVAALIAVYFISARVIAPLREISSAAKRFASGKFDTRVPVKGRDEVAELAIAFNNMAESLDNYDNMRNKFMSDVSHDLRSPMTSISGFIDGILDGVIPPEKHRYYLQTVSNEIKRLSRLVSTLLDLSRIQAGERKFTMSDFDICEMARQILISFEQKINAKHLDILFDCEEERLIVNADRDAIYQVLYNICDNAVKFSSEKGKLGITIKRIKGRKIRIDVFNEGVGIAEADINYVFERFYKSDKSRGLNKSGAGLGLFISKTIMDAHKQSIWVESEYGKNCCFSFTLDAE